MAFLRSVVMGALVAPIIFLISLSAHAACYEWRVNDDPSKKGPTAVDSCLAFTTRMQELQPQVNWTYHSFTPSGGNWGTCNAGTNGTMHFTTTQHEITCECNDPAGTKKTVTGPNLDNDVCVNNCVYTAPTGVTLILPGAVAGTYQTTMQSTGANCPAPTQGFEEMTDQNCITDGTRTVCVDKLNPNCGSFNGEYMCTGTFPVPENCITGVDGKMICTPNAVAQPKNETGTELQPHLSVTSYDETNNTYKNYNYYSDGTDYEEPVDPGDPNEPGNCGAPGQPKCDVDINESGTPTGSDNMYGDGLGGSGIDGLIDGMGDDPGFDTIDPGLISLPTGTGGCSSITYTVGGTSITFPGDYGCQILSIWKTIAAWALGIATAIACFNVATRKPA